MKILQKLTVNKIRIVFVIVHWIILLTALVKTFSSVNYFGSRDIFWENVLIPFMILDLPAIYFAALICLPLYAFVEDWTVSLYGVFLTSLVTITVQWLFIVKSIYNTISPTEAKLTSLSLIDE